MNLESECPVTDSIARATSKDWILKKKSIKSKLDIFSFNHGGLDNSQDLRII